MNTSSSLSKLKTYIESENFKGYDPYDALRSPIIRALSFNQKHIRIGFMQVLKRLPFNPRPFLLINKDYNPKGLGLFLWGYAKLYRIEKNPAHLIKIDSLLSLLDQRRCKGYSGNCWGYNFDWQSRAFYVPKQTPTIVNSSFIGHALIDTYRYTGNEKALEMAISIKDFLLNDLNREEHNGTFCFSYTPIDNYFVHNANLLGSSLLARLLRYSDQEDLKNSALSSLAYSMNHQRPDGSWYYAENSIANWIDSFHTGFNLQCIAYFLEEKLGNEYLDAFSRGVSFYSNSFFMDDGTPKYYHDKIYPLDIHSPSMAVIFFSKMGKDYRDLTERILKWMITNMQDEKGFFYFQKTQYYTNKVPYMRWAQSWAFHAITEYALARSMEADGES